MATSALVTGAAGFVGANLVRRLVNDGAEVHALTRPGSDLWRLDETRDHIENHRVDLLDDSALRAVVRATRPERIFHLAAHGAYSSQNESLRIVQTNVLGTVHLVQACMEIGFESFVNAGTSSEYGFKDHPPLEDESLEPASTYASSKAAATLWCRRIARDKDLPIHTLRLYSAFGPYEEPTRLVPTLAVKGLAGGLPPLVSPKSAHDFIYIDDVIDAFVLTAQSTELAPGSIFNIGSERQLSLEEVVAICRRILSIDDEPRWDSMAARQWDTHTWVSNTASAQSELNWKARVPFEQGLKRFVDWLRDNPSWLAFYRARMATVRPN